MQPSTLSTDCVCCQGPPEHFSIYPFPSGPLPSTAPPCLPLSCSSHGKEVDSIQCLSSYSFPSAQEAREKVKLSVYFQQMFWDIWLICARLTKNSTGFRRWNTLLGQTTALQLSPRSSGESEMSPSEPSAIIWAGKKLPPFAWAITRCQSGWVGLVSNNIQTVTRVARWECLLQF